MQAAITEQLDPGNIEVSLAGDLPVEAFERLVLQYMGTVPPAAPKKLRVPLKEREAISVQTLGRSQQLGVYLPDSDERAMGYLAGPAPNRWGFYPGGETVGSMLQKASNKKEGRRDHPLFGYVALLILQEVTYMDESSLLINLCSRSLLLLLLLWVHKYVVLIRWQTGGCSQWCVRSAS